MAEKPFLFFFYDCTKVHTKIYRPCKSKTNRVSTKKLILLNQKIELIKFLEDYYEFDNEEIDNIEKELIEIIKNEKIEMISKINNLQFKLIKLNWYVLNKN